MRLAFLFVLPLLAACATTPPPPTAEQRAVTWWGDVSTLADDKMEGRLTGSPGHQRAADHIAARLDSIGLEPAGTDGYFQQVDFEEQFVLAGPSSAALVSNGVAVPISIPRDMIIGRGDGRRPDMVDAPLVFVGYGLHIPEAGHDDFAGVDLAGKIAVVIGGGPAEISGALKSHARSQRARLLEEGGAVGMIALTTPKAIEIPWSRSMGSASQSGMYFADAELRDLRKPFVSASFNSETAEKLFARSGRSFAEVSALADASKPVPGFALGQSLRASIATRHAPVRSNNVVGVIPGSDPALRNEYVILSAHFDHLGVGEPVNGDPLFNGALDNGAGVASLLDIAQSLKSGPRPRRSILFVFVTAEEKGLLGSRYFTLRPTIPAGGRIVADLNFDMALPIFPLRSVTALGAEESSLGADARDVGEAMGLPLVPDPAPERNSFIRSDQYSFIREGIPSLAFKFGFAKDSPEAVIERQWRSTRYHAPSDDLNQPVEKADAVRLNQFVAALAARIANAPTRPTWNDQSFFRRFAK
ncbi:MAG TPA: M28 family metallopeptidase [Allosphingosinicella sp.]|nr:M28 family metallopeptidase [Allosphingosinicella sp.]